MLDETNLKVAVRVTIGGSAGSAWFADIDGYIYLVSAKHVFFENWRMAEHLYDQYCFIEGFDSEAKGFEIPFNMRIDLHAAAREGYFRKVPDHDLVAVCIGFVTKEHHFEGYDFTRGKAEQRGVPVFVQKAAMRVSTSLNIGDDVFVSGYPSSVAKYSQLDPTRPIVTKGVISSKSGTNSRVIISAPVFPGNSGCPVFVAGLVSENGNIVFSNYVIGTVTEFVPWENSQAIVQNSGFSVVEPIESILKMIKKISDEIKRDEIMRGSELKDVSQGKG